MRRRLVRRGDAGKVGDLPGARLLVQALRIASLARCDVGLDVDLVEPVARRAARDGAILPIRRDECRDTDYAGARKQRGHLADAADVLGAIFGREPEVGRQTMAHVVTVEHDNLKIADEQCFFECERECGFACAGESGEPQHRAFVPIA